MMKLCIDSNVFLKLQTNLNGRAIQSTQDFELVENLFKFLRSLFKAQKSETLDPFICNRVIQLAKDTLDKCLG